MALLILVLLVAVCSYFTLRPLFSPLYKVPAAHWSSRFSPLWILWTRWSGNELSRLIDAHRKHGPIVLVGPQDLSVSCYQDGIQKVYDAGFPKPAPFYSMFNYYRQRNAFTSLERNEHGLRRRRTACLYSKSALIQSEHLREVTVCLIYDRLLPRLNAAATGNCNGRIDGLDLSYRVCTDYLSSFLFGYSNGTDYLSSMPVLGKDLEFDGLSLWRFHYENLSCHEAFFVQETPGLYAFLKLVGINLLPKKYTDATAFLEGWMSQMVEKAERMIGWKQRTGLTLAPKDEPAVYETAMEAVRSDSPHLSEKEQRMQVASEMFDHISASREVLGLILGYAFWYLAQHPDAQHRISAELDAHGIDMSSRSHDSNTQDTGAPSRATQLDSLPYLHAVIDECLRMRPTSTPLPRITPADREVFVAGFSIPPGTRINSFQWFVHRDPRKWENVNCWDPQRWLQMDRVSGKKYNREDVLWPFASGPRMCLGNHLAYYCMQHILAVVCSRFVLTALPREERQCWPGSPEDELPIRVVLRG
ncbi:uncharacterized protein Aud_002375 [Aspergillus udagawae]|uniref:Cytochrome P450 n=1 Tax=Aspergillus udagawae TaxID=91492 RepID=A0A8E0QKI0_9EURO|nr:uncharacterized protein Aud_002375 [Aspergillus udagawae]GIC86015.1 hypothetical protein Aud_002375 [Aspergillus udagawae]